MRDLINLLIVKMADKDKAVKALVSLEAHFNNCSPAAKRRLNKFLEDSIKDMNVKFQKDKAKFDELGSYVKFDEVLQWTNRRAVSYTLLILISFKERSQSLPF